MTRAMADLLQLYPGTGERTLAGYYLQLGLHRQAGAGELLIYANYIASVDGRISLRDADRGAYMVPDAIANKRDWRLYQELAAQADVMLTSARYFRQLQAGCAQDLLPVGQEPAYVDLVAWRQQQGLASQPDVVVISASLDIPVAALQQVARQRRVIICTSEQACAQRGAALTAQGFELCTAGATQVDGAQLRSRLVERGYRSAYMIAGPLVHRTLIAAGALDYLFLTTRMTLLGQDAFHTILSGSSGAPASLQLQRLSLDRGVSPAQLFAQYALHPT